MNTCKICNPFSTLGYPFCGACGKRLEGVTGPERSDEPASDVEEAKPGRRGVGEIVELSKLLRLIYRMKDEARADKRRAQESSNPEHMSYFGGKYTALCKLRSEVLRMAEERSDLSNND